jgi:hypothetical protein
MTNKRNIIASNSLVLVNTAIDSNAIVLLSNTSFGNIVSVRDFTGNVRSNIPIYISTVGAVNFTNTSYSNFLIQQPFGSMSFAATGSNSWSVLNTFAFNTPTPTAISTSAMNLSSILFKDTNVLGHASVLNVDSVLKIDGSNVLSEDTSGNSGGPIIIPDPLIQQSIFASTTTVRHPIGTNSPLDSNTRVQTSGTITTSRVTFNNPLQTNSNQRVSVASNQLLYTNNYPINPVGGSIEFIYNIGIQGGSNIVLYPLYVGFLDNLHNGWWARPLYIGPASYQQYPQIFGFTVLPGYKLTVNETYNYPPNTIISITNTTNYPIRSNAYSNLIPNFTRYCEYKLEVIN